MNKPRKPGHVSIDRALFDGRQARLVASPIAHDAHRFVG